MKKVCAVLLLLLLILSATALGGCMKSKTISEDAIQLYFRERCTEQISIVRVQEELSGVGGSFYRVICKSERYDEPFVLMLYPDPEGETTVCLDGRYYTAEDEYPNLVIQNELASRAAACLEDPVMVRCRLETERCFTAEEFAGGADACLRLEGAEPFVRYYILLRPGTDPEAQRKKLEEALSRQGFPEQIVFLGTAIVTDQTQWKNWYLENYDNFDYYIKHNEASKNVEMFTIQPGGDKE